MRMSEAIWMASPFLVGREKKRVGGGRGGGGAGAAAEVERKADGLVRAAVELGRAQRLRQQSGAEPAGGSAHVVVGGVGAVLEDEPAGELEHGVVEVDGLLRHLDFFGGLHLPPVQQLLAPVLPLHLGGELLELLFERSEE